MKNIFRVLTFIVAFGNAIILDLNAQEYSNRYIEVKRLEKKRSVEIINPIQLIIYPGQDIVWQGRGGLGYRGRMIDEGTLDFGHIQFNFKIKDQTPRLIELRNGKTTHILERQRAYDNDNVDYIKASLPTEEDAEEFNINFVKNKDWKVMKRLNNKGQLYDGDIHENLIYEVRTERGFVVFYSIENTADYVYKLLFTNKNQVILEDLNGVEHMFYAYHYSPEEWVLTDENKTIYYFLQKK